MKITKVWIDAGCSACGICEDICPEVFKLEELATVIKGVDYNKYDDGIKEAAASCPVEVIGYE